MRLLLVEPQLPQEHTGNVLGQEVEPVSLVCCLDFLPPPMQVVHKMVSMLLMSIGGCFGINE